MMKRTVLTISFVLALLLLAPSLGLAQANEQTVPSGAEVLIPDGTSIHAELQKGLDANKVKVDDPVGLEVMEDVRSPMTGAVLIPKKAKLFGRVSSKASYLEPSKEKNGRTVLSLELARAEWKGGFAKLDCRAVQADTATVQVQPVIAREYEASTPRESDAFDCVVERQGSGTFTRCYPNPARRPNLLGPLLASRTQLPPEVVFVTDGKLVLPSSMHSLPAGTIFLLEHRVPSESTKAFESSRDAALKGEAEAQFRVGLMYHGGVGVAQNHAQAAEWYAKAAEQGHSRAQNNLGVLYAQGQGVPQDYATAYVWFSLASAADQEKTKAALQLLESQMTPEQIAEGKRRAEEWRKQHPAAH